MKNPFKEKQNMFFLRVYRTVSTQLPLVLTIVLYDLRLIAFTLEISIVVYSVCGMGVGGYLQAYPDESRGKLPGQKQISLRVKLPCLAKKT